jgi:hypothetical protein
LRILAREDELEDEEQPAPEPSQAIAPLGWRWMSAVAAIAAVPRLLYLFTISDPENPGLGVYDDVWHHWQIAYLTKEIGIFAPGGPRLWDLKGLDYFWGILHPLVMVTVFALTGSIDIVLLRLVSIAFGVLAVVLLFDICRRLWNVQVAVAAALFACLLPTSVMNDASGMLEPMGVALCLLGIWAWTRGSGGWSGIAFGLAAMARAEAWLFSLGLVIAAGRKRAGLWFGFGATIALYALVLWVKTGNPIYPLWWNFFANALGQWGTPITSDQQGVRPVLGLLLVAALIGLGWALRTRPTGYMLLTFGFGYWVFTAGMLGFTSFLSTWRWWMPISRRFEFPYEFAGVLLAIVLLHLFRPRRAALAWAAIVGALVATQLLWLPVGAAFGPTEAAWQQSLAESRQLGAWYNSAPYQGHAMAVPPDRPDITYGLARFGGVEGKHLVSEMYDPFGYPGASDTKVQCWLSANDVRLVAVSESDSNLMQVVRSHPDWFVEVGTMSRAGWKVEGVRAPQCPQTVS